MFFLSVFLRYQLVFLGVVAVWLGVAAAFHYGAACSPGNSLLNAVAVMAVPIGYLLDRTGKGAAVFAPAMCSAVLFWLAFFPANLGPLAYVALVPLLSLVRAEGVSGGRRYCAAWLGGVVFGFLSVKWIRVAHPMMALFAWPSLSLWCSVYWPLALGLLRVMDRYKLPFAVTLPLVWVALEYFRDHFPTAYPFMRPFGMYQLAGFGWYTLAYSQHAFIPLIQAADLGGTYLISAAVAAVNGAMYEWALRVKLFRRWVRLPRVWHAHTFHRELWVTALAGGFFALVLGYGTYRLIHPPFDVGPRVAALQHSIPQDAKMGDPFSLFALHDELCREANSPRVPTPDLILWPETCYPFADVTIAADSKLGGLEDPLAHDVHIQAGDFFPWYESELRRLQRERPTIDIEASMNAQRQRLGRALPLVELGRAEYARQNWKTNVLLGLTGYELAGGVETKFNSARLIRQDGSPGPRYDKMHLVPFGEYLPFRETFPFIKKFSPYPDPNFSCTPGEKLVRFEFETYRPKAVADKKPAAKAAPPAPDPKPVTYRFGVLICYEDTDPHLARRYNPLSGEPDPVDFLVNISNDGWFDGSEQHELHLAICRFRAIEARRSIVRAVNMGISCVIDPDGRIADTDWAGEPWAGSKKIRAIVAAGVKLDTRGSPYALLGDWVPAICWACVLLAIVLAARARRRAATVAS